MSAPSSASTPDSAQQRISVRSEELLAKVRELIHQGNVRRIHIIGEDGTSILEIPLTAGVIGALIAPVLVAVGAIAALAKNYTLLIEATAAPSAKQELRRQQGKPSSKTATPSSV